LGGPAGGNSSLLLERVRSVDKDFEGRASADFTVLGYGMAATTLRKKLRKKLLEQKLQRKTLRYKN
jgi:hypothetical protein